MREEGKLSFYLVNLDFEQEKNSIGNKQKHKLGEINWMLT